ncbi:MAG: hypothetical protein HPY65_18955 [Syntrophaceae bacterium]|nr:hypothetical protein [Syntrophaceae bacterium]
MSDSGGWVKLWRDQFHHEISERKPWCDGYAWSFLYARANHRPAIVNFRNQYIPVERGQFVTSELKLAKTFGWSRRRIKNFLTSLEIGGMCDNRRTQRFVVITICNYEKYQSRADDERAIDVTANVTTGEQQKHINKNKEEKNIYRQNALIVLSYLNERTGKRYRDTTLIEARLKDGGTVDDCRKIIDVKLMDPHFIANPKYLNPQTLFRPSHWDKYLNESMEPVKGNGGWGKVF